MDLVARLREDGEIVTKQLGDWAVAAGDRAFFHYGEDSVTLTYADFARRTDAIAGNLAAIGVAKGDRVSVFCANPLVSALVMFGTWKAGALYCPVNFAFAGRLLAYQLADTDPKLIVTEPRLLRSLNAVAAALPGAPAVAVYEAPPGAHDYLPERDASVLPEIEWAALTAEAAAPGAHVVFDDPASIVYTSGTTGPAKGVVQPYRWMAQYTYALRRVITPDDVIYNDLPMYHVGGAIANVARAAWAGCEVAVWDRFSPNAFWDRVGARQATTAILLDVMIPWLINAPQRADDRRNTLWFHTGDAAFRGADGYFYFVDRLGDRIRVRGENLSSFQVEDLLNQHPGIRFCAVLPICGAEGDEDDIVAFVVPDGTVLEEQALHAYAAETMPKYMRPAHIRIVDAIPRTPTSKIEKYKLRAQILGELGPTAAVPGSPDSAGRGPRSVSQG